MEVVFRTGDKTPPNIKPPLGCFALGGAFRIGGSDYLSTWGSRALASTNSGSFKKACGLERCLIPRALRKMIKRQLPGKKAYRRTTLNSGRSYSIPGLTISEISKSVP